MERLQNIEWTIKLIWHPLKIIGFIFLLTVYKSMGQNFEVMQLENHQRGLSTKQEELMIKDNEVLELLDQMDCDKINESQMKTSSKIKFNNVPVTISNFIALNCKEIEGKNQRSYTGEYIRSIQSIKSQRKRHLTSAFSSTQSVISGTGITNILTHLGTTTFEINTQVTIALTAKDSSGANINIGGEIVYIEISNTCTKGLNFGCVPDAGAYTVLTSNINIQMTDNFNGIYTYNYQVARPGSITIDILLYTQGGVYNEFFPDSTNESGNNAYNGTWETINLHSAIQDIYPGRQEYVSANFYFRFKSPTTGTLTFSIDVDDSVSMYIDDVLIISGGCSGICSGSIQANLNQFYNVHLTYWNGPLNSNLVMSWSYQGHALTLVPSTSLYYPNYVSNSPFNVTVVCPAKYFQIVSGLIPECANSCGNGIRDSGEQCDDMNPRNGDGCSSICMVEDGYVCTGGSSTTQDVCTKFAFVLPPNQSSSTSTSTSSSSSTSTNSSPTSTTTTATKQSSKPKVYTVSKSDKWMGLTLWLSILFCLFLEVILGLLTDKYPAGIYISIEHIQILSILPIAGSYFTNNTNGLFRIMRFALLGFDVINIRSLFSIEGDCDQTNETLEYLGFESGSGFYNILPFIYIGVCFVLLESFLFFLCRPLSKTIKTCSCFSKCCKKGAEFRNWICIGYHIRYLILGYLLMIISTANGISNYSNCKWSWWLSALTLLVILFLIAFLIVCFVNWISFAENGNELKMLDEFNKMLKKSTSATAYSPLFLLHRILFCVAICAMNNFDTQIKIISLICIQGTYFILLIMMRPFESVKANINKIVCECSVFVLIVLMYVYKSSSQWNSSTESVFLYTITCSCCVPCLITAVALFVQAIKGKQNKVNLKPQKVNTITVQKKYEETKISGNKVLAIEENKSVSQSNSSVMFNDFRSKRLPQLHATKNINNLRRIGQDFAMQLAQARFINQTEKDEGIDFDELMGYHTPSRDSQFIRNQWKIRDGKRAIYKR